MKIKFILLLAGVAAAVAGVVVVLSWDSEFEDGASAEPSARQGVRVAGQKSKGEKPDATRLKSDKRKSATDREDGKRAASSIPIAFSTPEDDERELNELEKAVLNQIRASLDDKKLHALRKAIALFYAPASKGGLEGRVPKELRLQAIEALGWFRPDTAADLMSFMADADEEVVEDAFTKFEMELDDWSLGDRDRAEILVQVMKDMTDSDRIDSLIMNLNNMRNSVKAQTIQTIMETGSSQAQATMKEQIGLYTETDVETVEDVQKWLESNPDESTDEEFYGPSKDN